MKWRLKFFYYISTLCPSKKSCLQDRFWRRSGISGIWNMNALTSHQHCDTSKEFFCCRVRCNVSEPTCGQTAHAVVQGWHVKRWYGWTSVFDNNTVLELIRLLCQYRELTDPAMFCRWMVEVKSNHVPRAQTRLASNHENICWWGVKNKFSSTLEDVQYCQYCVGISMILHMNTICTVAEYHQYWGGYSIL